MEKFARAVLYIMAAPFILVLFILLLPALLVGMFFDTTLFAWLVAFGAELTWLVMLYTIVVGLGVII